MEALFLKNILFDNSIKEILITKIKLDRKYIQIIKMEIFKKKAKS